MKKKMPKKNQLARFSNAFAMNAEIGFSTPRQFLLFLAIVSQTNPQDESEEMTGLISVQDIDKLIRADDAKRSGSFYKEVEHFIEEMMKGNYVKFYTDIIWEGERLPSYHAIFSTIAPVAVPAGNKMYRYKISEDMRPYIKGFLKNFVSISLPKGMQSVHAIRFLILAKSYHDNHKHGRKETTMLVEIANLKQILGIAGKYKVFKNFRRRVIEPIVAEINKYQFLSITNYEFIRTGRKITHIEFRLQDGTFLLSPQQEKNQIAIDFEGKPQNKKDDVPPSSKKIAKLTKAQFHAYEYLVERHCTPGIAYERIVTKMPSGEFIGWEDIFIQKAWERFEKVTKYKQPGRKAGAFVKWWMKGEFKDKLFSELMEEVTTEKKRKEREDPDGFANRQFAKDKPKAEFDAAIKKERTEGERPLEPSDGKQGGDFTAIGDLVKGFGKK